MRWETVRLQDVAEVGAGQSAPKEHLFSDKGTPFIRAGHLETLISGKPLQTLQKIPDDVSKSCKLKLLKKGSIVFAKSGMSATLNRVYQLTHDAFYVSHLASVVTNEKVLDSRYCCYFLQQFQPSKLIKDDSYPSIGLQDIGNITIPLPPLSVQKQIADTLDKADALRKKDEQLLQKYDELAQSIFYEMFGDPVRNEKGWPKKKFNEIGRLDRGVSKHRPRNAAELLNGPYPLIQTGDVANSGGYITSYNQTYSEIGLKQSKMWEKGTLCITIAANIAKTAVLTFDACFPDSIVGFVPNELASTNYVRFWLGFLQKTLEDTAPESAQKNINLGILRNLQVPIPPVEKQKQFEQCLSIIEKQKRNLKRTSQGSNHLFNSIVSAHFS